MLSHVQIIVTPGTIFCQTPLSTGLSCKNTGLGCHFPPQGIFLTQGLNPRSPASPALQVGSLPLSHQGSLITY